MTSAHNFQKTYLRWLQGRSSTMRTTAQKFKAVDLPSSVSEDWVIYAAHLWYGSSWAVTVKCSKDSTDEICLNDLTKSLTNWATPSWNSPATVPRLLDTVSNVATGFVVSIRSVLSPFSRKRLFAHGQLVPMIRHVVPTIHDDATNTNQRKTVH